MPRSVQPEDPSAARASVILVSDDLLARARVNAAATKAGVKLVVVAPGKETDLTGQPADLVVVDLDTVDPQTLTVTDENVVGYYSHIEPAKAAAAR
ncbi:MAG: hypothetical protein M3345_05365, partial [Actinomycetota bacterium]|nr:hypothetical protein [Actinomycetota bacterium]